MLLLTHTQRQHTKRDSLRSALGQHCTYEEKGVCRTLSKSYFDLTLKPDGTLYVYSHRISVGPYWCKIYLNSFGTRYHTVRIGGSGRKICYEAFPHQRIPNLYLENRIDTIGAKAFAFCTDMRTAHLSERLEEIEELAFRHCTSLEAIDVPAAARSMGERVFYECSGLKEAVFHSHFLWEIPAGTFEDCYSLEHVELPPRVREIGANAFLNCYALKSITFPDTLTRFGAFAFAHCSSLEEVRIPAGAKFNITTFTGCNLKRYIIPQSHPDFQSSGPLVLNKAGDTVMFVANGATGNCDIPNGVVSLKRQAFMVCKSLTSIHIPESVQEIGEERFRLCTALEELTFSAAAGIETIPVRCCVDARNLKRVVLPDGLKVIQEEAFQETGLEEIVLPASVQELGKGCFRKTPLQRLIVQGDSLEFLNPRNAGIPTTFALQADQIPLDQIPSALLKPVLRDCILRKEAGEPLPEDREQWALPYLKGHVSSLWKEPIFRNSILQNGFITARTYPKLMEQAVQEEDADLQARLLQYKEEHGLKVPE